MVFAKNHKLSCKNIMLAQPEKGGKPFPVELVEGQPFRAKACSGPQNYYFGKKCEDCGQTFGCKESCSLLFVFGGKDEHGEDKQPSDDPKNIWKGVWNSG